MIEYITLIILWICILLSWWGILINWKLRKEYKRKVKVFEDMIKQHTSILNEATNAKDEWLNDMRKKTT